MTDHKLRLIPGGKPDKPKRSRKAPGRTPWECRICEGDIGVRTRQLVKVRDQALEDGSGKIYGGSDIWVCAVCLARGRVTPITS